MLEEPITNPNHRCIYCKGREVLTRVGNTLLSNLDTANGFYFCKDKDECQRNIEAENTVVDYWFDEQGKLAKASITKNGITHLEVERK